MATRTAEKKEIKIGATTAPKVLELLNCILTLEGEDSITRNGEEIPVAVYNYRVPSRSFLGGVTTKLTLPLDEEALKDLTENHNSTGLRREHVTAPAEGLRPSGTGWYRLKDRPKEFRANVPEPGYTGPVVVVIDPDEIIWVGEE